jgi:hypothetical protein
MPGLMKSAKLKAIMDIISQMDDMDMDRLMPKEEMGMEEIKPGKKGLTIVKLESDKKPMMEMEEDEGEEEEDDEEVDPSSVLGRLQAKMKMKKGM